jgi:hypothetical protein
MRLVIATVAIAALAVQGRAQSLSSSLIVIDVSQITGDERERVTELAKSVLPGAETRVWSGPNASSVTRYRLSFTEAFEIFRGNASLLQAIRARECADGAPACGADLPVRARQSLDRFDQMARETLLELRHVVDELATRDGPRPHRLVFLTAGLPYRTEPRRELEGLKAALRRAAATIVAVDIRAADRFSPELRRLTEFVGGSLVLATPEGLRSLRLQLASADATGRADSLLSGPPVEARTPLPPEVQMAAKHAVAFAESAETLLADEHYVQEVKNRPSATAIPRDSTAGITIEKRQLDSEVALIQIVSGELWLLARDVQRIDGREVEPSQRRPLPKIQVGAVEEGVKQLREIAAQGARFNIGGIRRDINVPTLALWLLTPAVNQRFNFTVGGSETIDGHPVQVIRFRERRAPYLFQVDGIPVPVSGRVWLDRSHGVVMRTELLLQSSSQRSRASVVVNYQFDEKAEAWVPRDMAEHYRQALDSEFVVAKATYSNVRRFSTSARLVK